MDIAALLTRIDRIEAQLAIQQLAPRYAVAVDGRDLDALAALFVPGVDCGRWGRGRDALKAFYDPTLRQFYRSQHQIVGHVIDLDPQHPDRATGKVYCRAEHEDGDKWVVMTICYFDVYERHGGQWLFKSRDERHWYSCDVLERPGEPQFQNWDRFAAARYQPRLPHSFPHWEDYWSRSPGDEIAALTRRP